MRHRWIILLTALSAIVILPLCGILATGHSIEPYLEFPPRTRPVVHAAFSWPVFVALTLGIVSTVAPFAFRVLSSRGLVSRFKVRPSLLDVHEAALESPRSHFAGDERRIHVSRLTLHEQGGIPWWGWAGLVWTALAWILAWNRWEWVGEWQQHTFTSLWLGYIVVMNALAVGRTGTSIMLRHPGSFLLLFPLSAAFWWMFEYLNRFVQNWHYLGTREFSAAEYVLLATVPFSTVLPAVVSTADWLSTYPRISAGLDQTWPVPVVATRKAGWLMVVGAAGGLIGIGLWPDYLFPLVWVAPFLLITGLQLAREDETVLSAAARGDWRLAWVAALASLMCGFFWELWNSHSLAHWEYAIPFVHEFQLFEMPLLGYAGYLPFGLECLAIVQLVMPLPLSIAAIRSGSGKPLSTGSNARAMSRPPSLRPLPVARQAEEYRDRLLRETKTREASENIPDSEPA